MRELGVWKGARKVKDGRDWVNIKGMDTNMRRMTLLRLDYLD